MSRSIGRAWLRASAEPGAVPVVGVNDLRPRLVHSQPDEDDIELIPAYLPEGHPERLRRQIHGHFAAGGGKVPPLRLREALETLGQHLSQLQYSLAFRQLGP